MIVFRVCKLISITFRCVITRVTMVIVSLFVVICRMLNGWLRVWKVVTIRYCAWVVVSLNSSKFFLSKVKNIWNRWYWSISFRLSKCMNRRYFAWLRKNICIVYEVFLNWSIFFLVTLISRAAAKFFLRRFVRWWRN